MPSPRVQQQMFNLLRAMSTEQRLLILHYLQENGEVRVRELQGLLGLSQPTVSYHMRALQNGGLVRHDNKRVYRLAPGVSELLTTLENAAKKLKPIEV